MQSTIFHSAQRARVCRSRNVWVLLAVHLLAAPVAAQDMEPRRWEVSLSIGKGTGQSVRRELERSLGSSGFDDDVTCPPRFVGTICGGADVFRYPQSGAGTSNTWAGTVAYRIRPAFLIAAHYVRAELARATGHESTTDYEVYAKGTLASFALVPTWVARDTYRVGVGPALLGVRREARAQQWSLSGTQASDAATARTAGMLIHAAMVTRSDARAGFEVVLQHLLGGSVTARELTLTPESPLATLIVAPQQIRVSSTALRIGFVVRP